MFSPEYHCYEEVDTETGEVTFKRVVRRKATKFFREHYQEIYERRVSQYQDIVNECLRTDFWINRGLNANNVDSVMQVVEKNFRDCAMSPRLLAEYYVSYYGVDSGRCFDCDRSLQWFLRYTSVYDEFGDELCNEIDTSKFGYLDCEILDKIRYFWSGLLSCLSRTNGWKDNQKDYDVDEIYDFWNLKIA